MNIKSVIMIVIILILFNVIVPFPFNAIIAVIAVVLLVSAYKNRGSLSYAKA